MNRRPRVGISRCLTGEPVRHDGGHKLEAQVVDALGPEVEWVEVCPEVEAGMGVPREPIQLVASATPPGIRIVGVRSGADWTERMAAWSAARVGELAGLGLSGFVLKARSPSCGPREVPVHPAAESGGTPMATDRGRFADALVRALPGLPVEDEERLRDPETLRAFLDRVRSFQRRFRSEP